MLTTTLTDSRPKPTASSSRISKSDYSFDINHLVLFNFLASGSKMKPLIFRDETTRSFVHIKSYLIGIGKLFAERCISVLEQTDETRDYPSNLQSFEYQLFIDCLLLLSECAHQCHLDQLAARYALEILKVLSTIGEDNIYEKKIASGLVK
jgi:hypothetical protein